ncbi:MAG: hypothetical protein RSG50_09965 [Clostridia bacterium]
MANAWQIVADAARNFAGAIDRLLFGVSLWQAALVATLLLVLVILLSCAVARRGRKCAQLSEEKDKESYAAQRAERAADEQAKKAGEAARRLKAKLDGEIAQKDEAICALTSSVDQLTRFHDEYAGIPDARAEAARIVREAKDHAYVVANRTEMEYAEIIDHANQEAEAIRALAQQRLTRSHEALKAALARASEIVDEAHAEATRVAQIPYTPGPGLIEAPDKQSLTGEVPDKQPLTGDVPDKQSLTGDVPDKQPLTGDVPDKQAPTGDVPESSKDEE